jgi:hypothetical protein
MFHKKNGIYSLFLINTPLTCLCPNSECLVNHLLQPTNGPTLIPALRLLLKPLLILICQLRQVSLNLNRALPQTTMILKMRTGKTSWRSPPTADVGFFIPPFVFESASDETNQVIFLLPVV